MTETTSKNDPRPNPSLQKKSAARTAAVQCLYTQALQSKNTSPAKQVERLKKQLTGNKNEQTLQVGVPLEPNYKLLETLLEGVALRQNDIDERIARVLSKDWTPERMGPVLVAILQCAVYELFFGKEVKPKIIIDEYTRLTRSFCSNDEVDFVYGALSKLVEQLN